MHSITFEAQEQQRLFNALQHRRLAQQRREREQIEHTRALIAEDLHRARAALAQRDSMVATLDEASTKHDQRRRFTGEPVTGFGALA